MRLTPQRIVIISRLCCSAPTPDRRESLRPRRKRIPSKRASTAPSSTKVVSIRLPGRVLPANPDNPQVRKEIIDQLIMQTLIANAALKKGLDKSADGRSSRSS